MNGTDLIPTHAASSDKLQVTSSSTGLIVLLIILSSLLGPKVAARCRYLPEGSSACLLGLVTGCCLLVFYKYMAPGMVRQLLVFDANSFFTYVLPPVIFNAGLSIERRSFFHQLPRILAFGVCGTLISFAIISLILCGFAALHLLNVEDALALGAIFAATDSVATLQMLDQRAMPDLFGLIFGEGVMNDAISVVLLGAVSRLFHNSGAASGVGSASMFVLFSSLLGHFCYLFFSSLAVGLGIGLGIALLLKHFKCHGMHQEVCLVGLVSYLSYLLPEALGLSGILSLFFCGVAVSHYALHNITISGRSTTVGMFKTLSYICENLIFVFLGMDALDTGKWQASHSAQALVLFVVLLLVILVSRAMSVVSLSLLINAWSPDRLRSKDIMIIWWSGLMRGAVSVALVYYHFSDVSFHGGSAGKEETRHRATVIVATLITVLVTVFGIGALTQPLLQQIVSEPSRPLQDILHLSSAIKWARSCAPLNTRWEQARALSERLYVHPEDALRNTETASDDRPAGLAVAPCADTRRSASCREMPRPSTADVESLRITSSDTSSRHASLPAPSGASLSALDPMHHGDRANGVTASSVADIECPADTTLRSPSHDGRGLGTTTAVADDGAVGPSAGRQAGVGAATHVDDEFDSRSLFSFWGDLDHQFLQPIFGGPAVDTAALTEAQGLHSGGSGGSLRLQLASPTASLEMMSTSNSHTRRRNIGP